MVRYCFHFWRSWPIWPKTMFEETLGKNFYPTWSSPSCFCIEKWLHNPNQTEQTGLPLWAPSRWETKTFQGTVWIEFWLLCFSTCPRSAPNFRKLKINWAWTYLTTTRNPPATFDGYITADVDDRDIRCKLKSSVRCVADAALTVLRYGSNVAAVTVGVSSLFCASK